MRKKKRRIEVENTVAEKVVTLTFNMKEREHDNMMTLKLEAPWYSYQKKIKELFALDCDIKVGDIYEPEGKGADFVFDIEVRNHQKFLALDRVMPKTKAFGNIVLGICLFDEENVNGAEDVIALYETLFQGNPIVKDVKRVTDQAGIQYGFVRFRPEVIQFFDDDIRDFNGNWSGLAQDIAREVFVDELNGVHFCTADKNEAGDTDDAQNAI